MLGVAAPEGGLKYSRRRDAGIMMGDATACEFNLDGIGLTDSTAATTAGGAGGECRDPTMLPGSLASLDDACNGGRLGEGLVLGG